MSYKDNIIFTITSILKNSGVEKKFFEYLENENTTLEIETNEVCENKGSKLYPKIMNISTSNKIMLIMTIISLVISITSVIVNIFVTRHFKWSLFGYCRRYLYMDNCYEFYKEKCKYSLKSNVTGYFNRHTLCSTRLDNRI